MYIVMACAIGRAAYVSWGLQYDKYNIVADENYLYSATAVLVFWCIFELTRKNRELKSQG
jgi:hypothetical protein